MYLQLSFVFARCRCGVVWGSRLMKCSRSPHCDHIRSHRFVESGGPCPRCVLLLQLALVFFVTHRVFNPDAPLDFSTAILPQPGDPRHICDGFHFRFSHCVCGADVFWVGPPCVMASNHDRGRYRLQNREGAIHWYLRVLSSLSHDDWHGFSSALCKVVVRFYAGAIGSG
jgi:hypothetical protein